MGCFNLVEQYCLQRRKFLDTCHTVLKLIFAQWILWPNGGLRQSHTPSNNFRNYGRASNGFPNNFFCLVIHDALGGCFVHRAPSGYFCWRIYHVASAILNSLDQVGSSNNEPLINLTHLFDTHVNCQHFQFVDTFQTYKILDCGLLVGSVFMFV